MNNIEIIKKRLKDLKSLSEDLKKSSPSQKDQNLNIVQLIMDMTRDVQRKKDRSNDGDDGNDGLNGVVRKQSGVQGEGLMKMLIDGNRQSRQNNPNNKPLPKNSQNQPKNSQTVSTLKQQHSKQLQLHTQQNQALQSQLIKLTQQIKQLELTNYSLTLAVALEQDRVLRLEQERNRYQSQNQYRVEENVWVYVTKIRANQYEYQNIQYRLMGMSLNEGYIDINQPKKHSQNSTEIKDLSSRRQNSKKFDLYQLKQVKYFQNKLLILKITVEGVDHYIYMKFTDYQKMRKWDIAIFMNLVTVKSLKKERMFVDTDILENGKKQDKQYDGTIKKQRSSSQSEQDLIKSIEFKQQRDTKPSEEQILLDKHISDKLSQIIKNSQLNQRQAEILRQYYKQNQKLIRMYQKLKQSQILNRLQIKIEEPRENIGKNLSLRSSDMSKKVRNLEESVQNQFSILRGEQVNRKIEQNNLKQQLDNQKQDVILSNQQIEMQNKEKKKKQFADLRQRLKRPRYVTKYAEGAMKPHAKKIYLSLDQTQLCWQDKDEKDKSQFKFVLVDNIVSVQLGKIGPGVEKLLEKSEIGNLKNYVLINLKNQKRKTLEFSTNNPDLMENFSYNLTKFLEQRKNYDKEGNQKKAMKF